MTLRHPRGAATPSRQHRENYVFRASRSGLVVLLAAGALLAQACGSDSSSTDETTTTVDGGDSGPYAVDTSSCPADATEPITGTVKIGTTMPLSGGVAAAAFAPVAEGMKNYIAYANANDLLPGVKLELTIEDDQFNSNLTTPAVGKLIDSTGVNLFAGMIGTANNQAVRDLLNEECYPQLFVNSGAPIWGDVGEFPWTVGGLPPYNTETAIYVQDIEREFPDGATAAVFHVNSEFGDSYQKAFAGLADGANIDVVAEQTIENEDSNPPRAQINAIAAEAPDVVLAVPLGAQCITFLSEMANAKAANPGWAPRVYITSTCASTLILSVAGDAADGIFTIITAKDANDPGFAEDPQIRAYKTEMANLGFAADGDFATAGAGWTAGELTVEVLRQAAASEGGLTRASILEAARAMDYHFQLARDGINFITNGSQDAFGLESMQVVQYSAATKTYTDVGALVTAFEGKTKAS
ncbi:MAG: ABC transporter substrate-binding protein [Acidimicrobiales bacterium]